MARTSHTLKLSGVRGGCIELTLTDAFLCVQRTGHFNRKEYETDTRNVLWAECAGTMVEISLLVRKSAKAAWSFVQLNGRCAHGEEGTACAFTDLLMTAAYAGTKRQRRLRVLVNPHSGSGNAVSNYSKKVEPVLRASRCLVDVTFTRDRGHATEIVKELPLDDFDAIVTVSGDGLIHEVMNGFAARADAEKAFRTPVAPIPCGSGNGLSLDLLGIQDGSDVFAAALNAVKGQPMSVDLMSVQQNTERVYSFMTQTVGLLADVDLGTENMRFLGSGRFLLGFLRGVITMKHCPVTLSVKVAESDKTQMVHALHASRARFLPQKSNPHHSQSPSYGSATSVDPNGKDPGSASTAALPALDYASSADTDGWITLTCPLLYVYAGKGPFVSREFMQFPVSVPDDGLIDVVAQEVGSRRELLESISTAPQGGNFWLEHQHYFKAHAYRIEPYKPGGCFAVDGEAYPFAPFQVEVHRGLATLLSPCGYYQAKFDFPSDYETRKDTDDEEAGCFVCAS
ncbi:ATP-NAD kinase-like domain-containing protein [Sparassis latifolia]|uniref:Sphingoid long chain base kinase 4 n=1 Tax=Sparassis crispa TaxID=139825 RepID=A0A401GMV8_9APHY|nr:Sphingoid long chain base kinase 4 [Sparassis crispa]GBE83571.1 Sphingoid long chain base kinase 4 [Sparassis crispa]